MTIQSTTAHRTQPLARTSAPSGAGPVPQTVKQGDRGPAVQKLQTEMRAKGVYSGPITGYFGTRTLAAVKDFQKHHALVPDGIVGPKTWGALGKLGTGGPTPTPPTTGPTPSGGKLPFPPPHGLKEIERVFGQAGQNIVSTKLPLGPGGKEINVQLNAKMVPIMKQVLAEAKDKGLLQYIKTFNGMAVAPRLKRHPNGTPLVPHQWSLHSWGIGFDINADAKGGSVNPKLVSFLKSKGFTWGGDFKGNHDPMHFQYASGY